MRYAACIEYDGSQYCGWQRQTHSSSVQSHVEAAFSKVADHDIAVVCAGRTDTGVHASYQIVHFDTIAERTLNGWLRGVNVHLPNDISCQWVKPVADEFHARFSAVKRSYRYIIDNRAARPALSAGKVTWEYRPLELELMQRAAKCLLGKHDFTSFRTVACQAKSPVREISVLTLSQQGNYLYLDITANAFLHHMVRNIAGVLITVGCSERSPDWALQVLNARDRCKGGVTAPPDGLYLTAVEYPKEFKLPSPSSPIGFSK